MDNQSLLNTAFGAALAVAGWVGRELWSALKNLREDVHQIEVDLPSHYIRRDEFVDSMREIKDMLAKIFDKLDNKADK